MRSIRVCECDMTGTRRGRVGIVGVGNVFATDDAVGIHVLRRFREAVSDTRLTLVESERGGLDLLDRLEGFDAVLVVDAGLNGLTSPGEIASITYAAPFASGGCPSLHTVDLPGLLAFGEAAGMALPRTVTVLSVEALDIETFQEGCTPPLEAAIPVVVERLLREVRHLMPDVREASCRDTAAARC